MRNSKDQKELTAGKIRDARNNRGLTQEAVVDRLDQLIRAVNPNAKTLSLSTYQNWEQARTIPRHKEYYAALAEVLGVDEAYLLGDVDAKSQRQVVASGYTGLTPEAAEVLHFSGVRAAGHEHEKLVAVLSQIIAKEPERFFDFLSAARQTLEAPEKLRAQEAALSGALANVKQYAKPDNDPEAPLPYTIGENCPEIELEVLRLRLSDFRSLKHSQAVTRQEAARALENLLEAISRPCSYNEQLDQEVALAAGSDRSRARQYIEMSE